MTRKAQQNTLAANGSQLLASACGQTPAIPRRDEGLVVASEPHDDDSGLEHVADRLLVQIIGDRVTLTAVDTCRGLR
jgi:glutamine amidotransferase